jgi:P-aminobenzoate N-oxygenase AurF
MLPLLFRRPATLDAFVLAGEEIPDLFQRLAAEHPDTDDYVRAISRYHRLEEARHLAYARTTVGEHYRNTTRTDRFAVRWIVPTAIVVMFDTIVQPFVYPTVGLPAMRTWLRVRRQPERVALRQQCVRAVMHALIDAHVLTPGHIPRPWRHAAGVDNTGRDPLDQPADTVAIVHRNIARVSGLAWSTARSIYLRVSPWAGSQ